MWRLYYPSYSFSSNLLYDACARSRASLGGVYISRQTTRPTVLAQLTVVRYEDIAGVHTKHKMRDDAVRRTKVGQHKFCMSRLAKASWS